MFSFTISKKTFDDNNPSDSEEESINKKKVEMLEEFIDAQNNLRKENEYLKEVILSIRKDIILVKKLLEMNDELDKKEEKKEEVKPKRKYTKRKPKI